MQRRIIVLGFLVLGSLLAPFNLLAAAAPPAIDKLRASATALEKVCDPDQIIELQAKISSARDLAEQLSLELVRYKTERAKYEETLSMLRNALFASLLAALGVIGGWVVSSINVKADRDLKRLSIIEKARELSDAGLHIPPDIESKYLQSQGVRDG